VHETGAKLREFLTIKRMWMLPDIAHLKQFPPQAPKRRNQFDEPPREASELHLLPKALAKKRLQFSPCQRVTWKMHVLKDAKLRALAGKDLCGPRHIRQITPSVVLIRRAGIHQPTLREVLGHVIFIPIAALLHINEIPGPKVDRLHT